MIGRLLVIAALLVFGAEAQTTVVGGAGGGVSGLTTGKIPKATSATTIGDSGCSETSSIMTCPGGFNAGSGTESSRVVLPELTSGGHGTDQRIYGADSQATSGCIIWPTGVSTTSQVASDAGTTAHPTLNGVVDLTHTCRIFSWQAQALPSLVCTGTPPICTVFDSTLVSGASQINVKAGATQTSYQTTALQKWQDTAGLTHAAMAPAGGLFLGRAGNFIDSAPNYAFDGQLVLTDRLSFLSSGTHYLQIASSGGTLSTLLWNGTTNVSPASWTDQGYRQDGGVIPTLGSGSGDCGTSPAVETGSNSTSGRITVGSSTNGGICTVTFANTAPTARFPVCVVQDESTAQLIRSIPTSNKIAVFTGTLTAGDLLSYQCSWH